MAASTQLITDLGTVKTNGFSSTTNSNAIAAAGPIEDMPGNLASCILELQRTKDKLTRLQTNVDNGTDSANRTLIANVLLSLV